MVFKGGVLVPYDAYPRNVLGLPTTGVSGKEGDREGRGIVFGRCYVGHPVSSKLPANPQRGLAIFNHFESLLLFGELL